MPVGQLGNDMARFPMPDVADVSPWADAPVRTQGELEEEVYSAICTLPSCAHPQRCIHTGGLL